MQAQVRGRAARGALSAIEAAEADAAAAVAGAEQVLVAGDELVGGVDDSAAPEAVPPPEEGVYDEEELGETTGERF